MKLYIFNPDNDLALASGKENYTSPASARVMMSDLALLPRVWAGDGDCVMTCEDDVKGRSFDEIIPWGWNPMLRHKLVKLGVDAVPTEEHVAELRQFSNRSTSVKLLSIIRQTAKDGYCGESWICTNEDEIRTLLANQGKLVVKAPWSCSGKGVRMVDEYSENISGWVRRLLIQQGSVEVEPLYDKVLDFAMEFERNKHGDVVYLGLSLFTTVRGAYTGNVVASEEQKREILSHFVILDIIDRLITDMIRQTAMLFRHSAFNGVFGVDMMVCRDLEGRLMVHPCVEVNLRHTMGWVALQLQKLMPSDKPCRYFIDYDADSMQLVERVTRDVESGKARLLTPLHTDVHYVALFYYE